MKLSNSEMMDFLQGFIIVRRVCVTDVAKRLNQIDNIYRRVLFNHGLPYLPADELLTKLRNNELSIKQSRKRSDPGIRSQECDE